MNNSARGSAFDDFLRDDGGLEEADEIALRRVLAWQIEQERVAHRMTKAELARRIGTSRSHLDRILRAEEPGIRLETLERSARALGRCLRFELV